MLLKPIVCRPTKRFISLFQWTSNDDSMLYFSLFLVCIIIIMNRFQIGFFSVVISGWHFHSGKQFALDPRKWYSLWFWEMKSGFSLYKRLQNVYVEGRRTMTLETPSVVKWPGAKLWLKVTRKPPHFQMEPPQIVSICFLSDVQRGFMMYVPSKLSVLFMCMF